jgi:hypothetical protein
MTAPAQIATVNLVVLPSVGQLMSCHEVNVNDACDGTPELAYFEEIHEIVAVRIPGHRDFGGFDAIVTTRLAKTVGVLFDRELRFDWVFRAAGIKNSQGVVSKQIQFLSINGIGDTAWACLLPTTEASLNWFTRNRFCILTGAFEARQDIIDAIPTSVMAQALDAIEKAAEARDEANRTRAALASIPDAQPSEITVVTGTSCR